MAGMVQQAELRAQRQQQARSLRRDGLSDVDIAAQLGVSRVTVAKYLRGEPMNNTRSRAGRAQAMNAANPAVMADQTEQAFKLRLQGLSKTAIAVQMGASLGAVTRWLDTAIESRISPKVEEYRRLENARLDYYLERLSTAIEARDPKAIALALQVSQRRANLNGLDAPVKFDVSGGVSEGDQQVRALIEEVERRNQVIEAEIVGETVVEEVPGTDVAVQP